MKSAKLLAFFLGAALSCMAELAFAQAATLFELSGTAQAIPNVGAPRTLRMGDTLNQGDTVATGANSSAVLQFADGHVVALSGASRATITTYMFDQANPANGKVSITLAEGGMRAVTGSIGKANPSAVSYQAADAKIAVQGTDVNIATAAGLVAVTVNDGLITFQLPGQQAVSIPAGQGLIKKRDGTTSSAPAAQIIAALRALAATSAALANAPGATQEQKDAAAATAAAATDMVAALSTATSSSITTAINRANAISARPPTPPAPPNPPVPPTFPGKGSPTGAGSTGSGGGGKGSGS